MSQENQIAAPDSTAVRVALCRALHVEVDPPPRVLEDKVGLKLVAPDDGWRDLPDMSYFAGRTDGLRPPNNSEELLVATT
jgi:hypothetical protein